MKFLPAMPALFMAIASDIHNFLSHSVVLGPVTRSQLSSERLGITVLLLEKESIGFDGLQTVSATYELFCCLENSASHGFLCFPLPHTEEALGASKGSPTLANHNGCIPLPYCAGQHFIEDTVAVHPCGKHSCIAG